MTIPPGIRPESARNPHSVPADDALNTASQPRNPGLGIGVSLDAQPPQIAEAIRRTPQALALARIITDLRPDWTAHDVFRWCLADDRPWAVVCRVGIIGAADSSVRHPNGLRHVNPTTGEAPTPIPPPITEVYTPLRTCDHGGVEGRCPSCRTTWRTEVVA